MTPTPQVRQANTSMYEKAVLRVNCWLEKEFYVQKRILSSKKELCAPAPVVAKKSFSKQASLQHTGTKKNFNFLAVSQH